MMEAARTSETLVNFYQTTRCYNPEDSNLHAICCLVWFGLVWLGYVRLGLVGLRFFFRCVMFGWVVLCCVVLFSDVLCFIMLFFDKFSYLVSVRLVWFGWVRLDWFSYR
jgi:hypothetical protein